MTVYMQLLHRLRTLNDERLKTHDDGNGKYYTIDLNNDSKILMIPNNITSIKDIKSIDKAFFGSLVVCGGAGLVDIKNMFNGLELSALDLNPLNLQRVRHADYAFANTSIERINFNGLSIPNIETMVGMFFNANTRMIDVSGINTKNVEDMHVVFAGTRGKIIGLDKLKTDNVRDMSGMFEGSKVEHLDLSTFNYKNVKNISRMFYCTNIRSVDLGRLNIVDGTYMDNIFMMNRYRNKPLSVKVQCEPGVLRALKKEASLARVVNRNEIVINS